MLYIHVGVLEFFVIYGFVHIRTEFKIRFAIKEKYKGILENTHLSHSRPRPAPFLGLLSRTAWPTTTWAPLSSPVAVPVHLT
jgi:hypothetical protein